MYMYIVLVVMERKKILLICQRTFQIFYRFKMQNNGNGPNFSIKYYLPFYAVNTYLAMINCMSKDFTFRY